MSLGGGEASLPSHYFLRNVATCQADYGTACLFVFDSVRSQAIKIHVTAKKKALASQSVSHCDVVMTLQRSDIENDKITLFELAQLLKRLQKDSFSPPSHQPA